MRKLFFTVTLILLMPLNVNANSIYFSSVHTDVFQNDDFSIEVLANISTPILGWGLDLDYDPSLLSLTNVTVNPAWWMGIAGMDGDFLAGLAFPLPVSGNSIPLATLNFTAVDIGTTDLTLSVTIGDFTEGFALVPAGFADLTEAFIDSSVEVRPSPIPEPTSILLFGVGFIGLLSITSKKRI